jgi:hypothetical protein
MHSSQEPGLIGGQDGYEITDAMPREKYGSGRLPLTENNQMVS